jgi:putative ATPase
VGQLLDRAVADERGLAGRVTLAGAARADLVRFAGGDARRALTYLEASAEGALAAAVASVTEGVAEPPGPAETPGRGTPGGGTPGGGTPGGGTPGGGTPGGARPPTAAGTAPALVTPEHVAAAVQRALVRYDRSGDQHYDVISAFIKSIRGSDVDAALHYLARMIEAGEDPRFIARRLVILASEDVGLADPGALGVATAAMTAAAQIGLPEARLPLAQATIHLSLAPKSNAVIRAIDAAQEDIRAGRVGPVPPHLRDGHHPGAAAQGVVGYRYPHDDPAGVLAQQYAPHEVLGRRYYQPGGHGVEARLAELAERLRATVDGLAPPGPTRPTS